MALWLAIGAAAGAALVEFLRWALSWPWLPRIAHRLRACLEALLVAEDDDQRQRAVLRVAGHLLAGSLVLLLGMGAAALWMYGFVALGAPTAPQEGAYWIGQTVAALGWWWLRRRAFGRLRAAYAAAPGPSPYSLSQKFLHWVVLDSAWVRKLMFEVERAIFLPRRPAPATDESSQPVYVCGLARSGTTLVLRVLEQTGGFASLSYRDMPFVLAPNLWDRITRASWHQMSKVERAHGDGIAVDLDSPEAFEEVFWRTHSADDYETGPAGLNFRHAPDTLPAFADYRRLVVMKEERRRGQRLRYLSKNNNHLMRLDLMARQDQGRVLVVYRHPLAVAHSLWRQHQRFSAMQAEDAFGRRYMQWLGHFEFGLSHVPFAAIAARQSGRYSPADMNYWLETWVLAHEALLSGAHLQEEGVHLLNYEWLCASPKAAIADLLGLLYMQEMASGIQEKIRPSHVPEISADSLDEAWVQRALGVYQSLAAHPANLFKPHSSRNEIQDDL